MRTNPTLVFLVYLSRSGSTMLADLLARHEGVAVSNEAAIPDGIYYPGFSLGSPDDLASYLDRCYADHKFSSWKIDRTELERTLRRKLTYPARFDQILPVLLDNALDEPNLKIRIFKSSYVTRIAETHLLFPSAKFLLIVRDPRAVHNSARRTINTDTGKPMAESAFISASSFNKLDKSIAEFAGQPWFHYLRYEDLIVQRNQEIDRIFDFFAIDIPPLRQHYDYTSKLSEKQRTIHPNVGKNPLKERIDGWKEEIDPVDVRIIQAMCGLAMSSHRYRKTDPAPLNRRQILGLIGESARYSGFSLKRSIELLFRFSRLSRCRGVMGH